MWSQAHVAEVGEWRKAALEYEELRAHEEMMLNARSLLGCGAHRPEPATDVETAARLAESVAVLAKRGIDRPQRPTFKLLADAEHWARLSVRIKAKQRSQSICGSIELVNELRAQLGQPTSPRAAADG